MSVLKTGAVIADGAKLNTLSDAVAHLGKTIPKFDCPVGDHRIPATLCKVKLPRQVASCLITVER